MPKSRKSARTGQTGPPPPPPSAPRRARRLKSVENVRQFVASVLRQVETGAEQGKPLDPARARCLLYGASILEQLIRTSDVERRVAALEAKDREA